MIGGVHCRPETRSSETSSWHLNSPRVTSDPRVVVFRQLVGTVSFVVTVPAVLHGFLPASINRIAPFTNAHIAKTRRQERESNGMH